MIVFRKFLGHSMIITFFVLSSVSVIAMNDLEDENSSSLRQAAVSQGASSLDSLSTREDVKSFTPFFKYIESALRSDHRYRTEVLFPKRADVPETFPLCLSLKTRAFIAALDCRQSLRDFLTKEDIQRIVGPLFRFGYLGTERRGLYALQSMLNRFLLDEAQKDHPLRQNRDNLQLIIEPMTLMTPLLTYITFSPAIKEVIADLYVNVDQPAQNYSSSPSEIEKQLAQEISNNKFLRSLWVENLSWKGFEALGRAVSENKTLTSLRFGMMNNRISEDALRAFEDSATLQRIILDDSAYEWTIECLRQVAMRRGIEVFVVGSTPNSRHKTYDPLTKLFVEISHEDLCERLDRKPSIDLPPLKEAVTEE